MRSPLRVLARLGYAASALVHVLLGVLAIRVAVTHGGEADQSGAIAQIGALPGGPLLLWVTTVGLFALALWLAVEAVLGIGSSSKRRGVRSLVAAAKAVAYLALGITAFTFARGSSSSADASSQQASAGILGLPGGSVLLGLIGVATIAIGVYLVVKGARQRFVDDIRVPNGSARRPVLVLGTVGYIAKGIAVGVVGILFLVAAATLDPSAATGLDGALHALAGLPFGVVILVAVGLGLIAFGVYSFARARLARL